MRKEGYFWDFSRGQYHQWTDVGSIRPDLPSKPPHSCRSEHALGIESTLRFPRLDLTEPWPSGLFRVVSMIDVLHHVDRSQQKALFQKVAERVKPGGLFLYKDMANGPFLPAAMNRLHDLVLARQWISYVPIAEADRWAEEMGLVREHAEEISRLWYRHELRLYRKPA